MKKNPIQTVSNKRDFSVVHVHQRSVVRLFLLLSVVTHLRHLMFRRVTASNVFLIVYEGTLKEEKTLFSFTEWEKSPNEDAVTDSKSENYSQSDRLK